MVGKKVPVVEVCVSRMGEMSRGRGSSSSGGGGRGRAAGGGDEERRRPLVADMMEEKADNGNKASSAAAAAGDRAREKYGQYRMRHGLPKKILKMSDY